MFCLLNRKLLQLHWLYLIRLMPIAMHISLSVHIFVLFDFSWILVVFVLDQWLNLFVYGSENVLLWNVCNSTVFMDQSISPITWYSDIDILMSFLSPFPFQISSHFLNLLHYLIVQYIEPQCILVLISYNWRHYLFIDKSIDSIVPPIEYDLFPWVSA